MNTPGYEEARQLLAQALRERAPATAEAFAEISPLSYQENACVFTLATLLAFVDGAHEHDEPAIPMNERMERQKAEFDAADELKEQIRRIGMTPVVDEDYPAVRYDYEQALEKFLRACAANGRKLSR